jgi:hypothetical protein
LRAPFNSLIVCSFHRTQSGRQYPSDDALIQAVSAPAFQPKRTLKTGTSTAAFALPSTWRLAAGKGCAAIDVEVKLPGTSQPIVLQLAIDTRPGRPGDVYTGGTAARRFVTVIPVPVSTQHAPCSRARQGEIGKCGAYYLQRKIKVR